jgi:hypothetical protein
MRRLTLILSDLYLPTGAPKESFPAALELPALSWLLRFARAPRRIDDWRSWLARELGADDVAELPVAQVCAQGAAPNLTNCWLAAPVALEARLDHVRLRDRGLLRLSVEERQALCAEFQRTFGAPLELRDAGGPAFLLAGGPGADIHSVDPARLLDADIGQALPAGSPAAGELRRLGTEIEMWLHASRVNAAREQAGRHRITALWLWGGGAPRPGRDRPGEQREFQLYGGDPYVSALRQRFGALRSPPPASLGSLSTGAPAYLEFAPMSGAGSECLAALEQDWFAPARAALSAGSLDTLQLIANDRVFQVEARAGWKFWRRRRGWLESLAG